jgi:hypothetical protein
LRPFADKLSQQHTESFTQQKLNAAETLKFKLMASDSHAKLSTTSSAPLKEMATLA